MPAPTSFALLDEAVVSDGHHFTVFAEQLSIPTAILVSQGAAIVQHGTETWWLKDTDGDDVADTRKLLISGWSMNDTHGGVSHFQYGLDNWIYAMQGYNDSHPVLEPAKKERSDSVDRNRHALIVNSRAPSGDI